MAVMTACQTDRLGLIGIPGLAATPWRSQSVPALLGPRLIGPERNLPNQRRACLVALSLAEALANAVGEHIVLQDLKPAMDGAELRRGLAVEVEHHAGDDPTMAPATSGTTEANCKPCNSEIAIRALPG